MKIKGTYISVGIGFLLCSLCTGYYFTGFVTLPIFLNFFQYISLLVGIIGLTFGMYKFFYVLEIKYEHSESNRIKSHYFITLNKDRFSEVVCLNDKEIIEKYNKDNTELEEAGKLLNTVTLKPRK